MNALGFILTPLRAPFRAIGWVVSEWVPAQAVRCALSRDFDAAAGRAADALTDAEEDVAEPESARPPGFYVTLTRAFAAKRYSFPSGPKPGDAHTASDGGEWVYNWDGIWEAISYPPDGDPYARIKAQERATSKPVNHYPELPGAWGGDCEYCDTGKPHPGGPKGSASPADTSAVPHADTPVGVQSPRAPTGPPDLGEMFGVVHGALAVGTAIGAFDPGDRDTWKTTAHELREFADVLDPPKQKQ